MKPTIVLSLALLTITAVAAPTESRPPWITVADNGKTVAVEVRQPVTITLKGNPTTGYLWTVTSLSSNTVEQVGEVEYRRDDAGKRMVGSGGVFVATFKAVRAGKTTVRMEYRRPWEKDVAPIETFAVTLDVK